MENWKLFTVPAAAIRAPGTISPHSLVTLASVGGVVSSSVPNVALSVPQAIGTFAVGRIPFPWTAKGWSKPTTEPITGVWDGVELPQLAASSPIAPEQAMNAFRTR